MKRNSDNHCYLPKKAHKLPFLDFHILVRARPTKTQDFDASQFQTLLDTLPALPALLPEF